VTEKIKLLDPTKQEVMLADGKVFRVPATWDFKKYKVGENVRVTYEEKNGNMMASEIVPAS
jgi:hypothetical protein